MVAPQISEIRRGREGARTVAWRGDEAVALLTVSPDTPFLSADFVRHCLSNLAEQGFSRVVTGALSPLQQAGFLAAGFGVEERLRLLGLDLALPLPPLPRGPRLRRVRSGRRRSVLELDRAAFPDFWRFDELALRDALAATPAVRFRMAAARRATPGGYAICGRAGRRGYVQRLAVHPTMQGQGVGRRLLLDGLYWMAEHGVGRVLVNTQRGNDQALALYSAVGFRDEPVGLSVLSAGLR